MTGFNSDEILSSLPSKYYVIDLKSKRIIQTNNSEIDTSKAVCYKHFFEKKVPCELTNGKCTLQQLAEEKSEVEFIIEKGQGIKKHFYRANAKILKKDLATVCFTDITDQVRFSKELKINSKRLFRAETLAEFGYWEFNIDEKIMVSSEGARQIYGITNRPITVSEIGKIALLKYRDAIDKMLDELIETGKPYNIKFEIRRPKDGEIRHIHSIAEYRKDKRMVYGVIHDITKATQAHFTIEESKEYLQLLFSNMNSAFSYHRLITNESNEAVDYIFLDVNPKFEELTGLKREDILNKKVREILPRTEDYWIKRCGEVALGGNPISFTDYSIEFDKYFEVSVFSPKREYFAASFTDVTDKINSDRAIQEMVKDLEIAQKYAKMGSWKFDPEGNAPFLSSMVREIFEIDQKDGFISFDDFKKYFQEQYDSFEEEFTKAKAEGIPFDIQLKLNLPSKKPKWIKLICQPDTTPGPKGYFLRGSIQDITKSVKNQEELGKTNRLLRTVIDNIPDAIYMKDANYKKLIANKGDLNNSGFKDISDIIGKSDFEIYPKEIAESYYKDDREVIEKGNKIINREEILPSKSKYRWVLTSKFPLKDSDGKIYGLVGIGRDISEIKEKEHQLRLLQKTVEQSPLAVVITNSEGEIEYVNHGFEKETGYALKEVIGKNPNILKSGQHSNEYYKEMWDTVLSGNNWYGEFYNKRKNGTHYWENAVLTPIHDESHKITHIVAIKENISELKQVIAELEKAKEKAIESDRLKTLFLANMSHEIRTPLNGILGFSSIICSGVSDQEQLEYYGQIIENSGRRLMTVIDDIIDISMIQSNQLKLDYEEFEINELLQEIFVVYHTQYSENLSNIVFNVEYCEDHELNYIYSDKNRIFQVFKNLLDNAFKFTAEGSIEFGCKSASADEIELYVKDAGIGIEDSKQQIIFESFRQAEEGNSRKYEGSGLGLAIITGILEKLKGRISLHSKLGKGSIFYITLPRNDKRTIKQVEIDDSEIKKPSKRTIMAKRIVSFEDDSSSVEYLKTVVGMLGYNLVNFVYAKEGIEYLRNNTVDMVLMDIQLPEMNGLEATKIIKSEFPHIPVLVQTAFAMSGDMERAFEAGCDDYLSKPLSVESLKEKIKKYVEMES